MPFWLKLMLLALTAFPGAVAAAAAAGLGAVSSDLSSARELPFAVNGLPPMLLLGPMMLRPDSWPEALTVIWPDDCCWLCCWSRLACWSLLCNCCWRISCCCCCWRTECFCALNATLLELLLELGLLLLLFAGGVRALLLLLLLPGDVLLPVYLLLRKADERAAAAAAAAVLLVLPVLPELLVGLCGASVPGPLAVRRLPSTDELSPAACCWCWCGCCCCCSGKQRNMSKLARYVTMGMFAELMLEW
jgi:hypothetical protein